jgi:hypothetical protein
VNAAVPHVHAIDEGITKGAAGLDDPSAHAEDVVTLPRTCHVSQYSAMARFRKPTLVAIRAAVGN